MESLSAQLYAFAITILAGASSGLIFDGYRLLRSVLRPGVWSTAVMDLFFWLVLAPVLTIYLLMANWGELRFYVVIGVVLGLAFYYLLFSHLIIRSLVLFMNSIGKIISGILGILIPIMVLPVGLIQDIGLGARARGRGRKKFRIMPALRWQSMGWANLRRR